MKAMLLAGLLFASAARADQALEVLELQLPESPAWGTNEARITIRNTGPAAQKALINWRSSSLAMQRNWALDSSEVIGAGETKTFSSAFILPAFPGKVTLLFRVRAEDGETVLRRIETEYDFPFANARANPLRLPPVLQKAMPVSLPVYPRLCMSQRGHIVVYYLEGDAHVAGRIDEIAAERARIYRELAARLNPAFDADIAVYLFPDAESKLAYTMHRGMGWARGRVLVEIFNANQRIDPYHEVTHIIAGSIGEPPALFSEGFAAYSQEGHRWDGVAADSWAKSFAERGLLWPMEKIFAFTEFGSEASRAGVAYPQGASFVGFLIDRYGWDRFLRAYRTLQNSADAKANAAKFEAIYGTSVGALEQAWLAMLARDSMPVAPEKAVAEIAAKYRQP